MSREIEFSERIFSVKKRLVSVDGPDGVGKGTFCEVMAGLLGESFLRDKFICTSGTRFEACVGSQKLGSKLLTTTDIVRRNRLFLFSTRMIFKEVVRPNLDLGNIVILDSSALRHLAYTLSQFGEKSPVFLDTKELVTGGVLDYGIFPGVRIVLRANEEGLLKNLEGRDSSDNGDPKNLEDVKGRVSAYREARKIIERLPTDTPCQWLDIDNPSLPRNQIREYLEAVITRDVLPVIERNFS